MTNENNNKKMYIWSYATQDNFVNLPLLKFVHCCYSRKNNQLEDLPTPRESNT